MPGLSSTPVSEWFRTLGFANDDDDVEAKLEEIDEVLSDLVGDDLTMADLGPGALDEEQLQEVLEALELTDQDAALVTSSLAALRPQLAAEAAAEAALRKTEAASAAAAERERMATEARAAAAAAAAAAPGTPSDFADAPDFDSDNDGWGDDDNDDGWSDDNDDDWGDDHAARSGENGKATGQAERAAGEEEAARITAEKEQARAAAEQEEARIAAEEEAARVAAAQEAARIAQEEAARVEAEAERARIMFEEQEAARMAAQKAEEEQARAAAEQEEARIAAEEEAARVAAAQEAARVAEEELARAAAERADHDRLVAEQEAAIAAEEAERERLAVERAEQARIALEEAARVEAEAERARIMFEEQEAARMAAQKEEEERIAAAEREAERAAAEAEAARIVAEEEQARAAAEQEEARIAAEDEAARVAAAQEAARVAEEEELARAAAERAEQQRVDEETEAARAAEIEQARLAAQQMEMERLAAEQEAARVAAEESFLQRIAAEQEAEAVAAAEALTTADAAWAKSETMLTPSVLGYSGAEFTSPTPPHSVYSATLGGMLTDTPPETLTAVLPSTTAAILNDDNSEDEGELPTWEEVVDSLDLTPHQRSELPGCVEEGFEVQQLLDMDDADFEVAVLDDTDLALTATQKAKFTAVRAHLIVQAAAKKLRALSETQQDDLRDIEASSNSVPDVGSADLDGEQEQAAATAEDEEKSRAAAEEEEKVKAEAAAAAAEEEEKKAKAARIAAGLELPERVHLGVLRDAVMHGHLPLVRRLLDEKANALGNLAQPSDNGPTPLHWAASHGFQEIAALLMEGVNNWQVVTQQEDGKTPMHLACLHRHAGIAQMMIEKRPARMKPPMLLGMRDENQRTALLCACCVSGNAASAAVVLEHGADVNAEDKHRLRPLHLAAMQGDVDLTRALLLHNPDLDALDGQGRTALLCATMEGHAEVVQSLVSAGASVDVKDANGADAAEWAKDLEHDEILDIVVGNPGAESAQEQTSSSHIDQPVAETEHPVNRVENTDDKDSETTREQQHPSIFEVACAQQVEQREGGTIDALSAQQEAALARKERLSKAGNKQLTALGRAWADSAAADIAQRQAAAGLGTIQRKDTPATGSLMMTEHVQEQEQEPEQEHHTDVLIGTSPGAPKLDPDRADLTPAVATMRDLETVVENEHEQQQGERAQIREEDLKHTSSALNDESQQEEQREVVVTVGTDEEFDELLQKTTSAGMAMLVDFGAKWCAPCKAIAPLFTELAAAASAGAKNTLFVKVDIDDCEDTAEEYAVSQLPTFLLLDKNAQKVEMLAAGSPEALRDFVDRHCHTHSVSSAGRDRASDTASEIQLIQVPALGTLSAQQMTADGVERSGTQEQGTERTADSAAGDEHQLTADEQTAIAAKLMEADALNDEVERAIQVGQSPRIAPVEATDPTAQPAQTGTSATDALMGSLFGGVWSWMSGEDLLEQR